MKRREFLGSLVGGSLGLVSPLSVHSSPNHLAQYQLIAGVGKAALLPPGQPDVNVWGYNGVSPGPLLRFKQGQPVSVLLKNKLEQATTLHWHGLRIPNNMDGVPDVTQKAVPAGHEFKYEFVPPDAGTYWYHSHNRTWEQMARGLAGPIIVEEKNPPKVDQDLLLALDDWRITNQGQIDESTLGSMRDWGHGGREGNWLTVNGKPRPIYKVSAGERVRLRLINMANSRIMSLQFNEMRPSIIAVDGQPIQPAVLKQGHIVIAPGQRYDLMVDMENKPGSQSSIAMVVQNQQYELVRFEYHKTRVVRNNLLPDSIRLTDNPLSSDFKLKTAAQVDLRMEGGAMGGMVNARYKGKKISMMQMMQNRKVWALNGVIDMPDEPLLRIKKGKTVIIKLINDNRWPHAMHLHGHHFKLLKGNENKMSGAWRDTMLIEPGDTQRIAFVADNPVHTSFCDIDKTSKINIMDSSHTRMSAKSVRHIRSKESCSPNICSH